MPQAKPSFIQSPQTPPSSEDKLIAIRDKIREARNLQLEKTEHEERLEVIKNKLTYIQQQELPEMLNQAGIDRLGLESEGNYSAYDLKLRPYYYANIKNDEETAPEAYSWLIKSGHEDLLRTTYTVIFKKGTPTALIRKFETLLDRLQIPFNKVFGVPWNTLTAFLKEQVEIKKTIPPLHLMNGKIGSFAEIKPRKPVNKIKERMSDDIIPY